MDSPDRDSEAKSVDEEIREATNTLKEDDVAKRHDPMFKDDSITKVKYIYEDYRRNPIEKNQLILLIMQLIKQEIEYQKDQMKLEKQLKRVEIEIRNKHMMAKEVTV